MAVNIFTDQMQHAELFGKPVLTTNWLIPRETVPDGWWCYDMQGADDDPGAHAVLVDYATFGHSGSVLSPEPLKQPTAIFRQIGPHDYFLPPPPMRRGFFMPCRPRRTSGWGQSATSASISGTRDRNFGTLGGPGVPRI